MNINAVLDELRKTYPKKTIILNNKDNLTEILCETEPSGLHADYSVAVSVIDATSSHFHRKTAETYEVIKGTLALTVDGKTTSLAPGESMVIAPGSVHSALGNETWIKVTSRPGWTASDHLPASAKNEE